MVAGPFVLQFRRGSGFPEHRGGTFWTAGVCVCLSVGLQRHAHVLFLYLLRRFSGAVPAGPPLSLAEVGGARCRNDSGPAVGAVAEFQPRVRDHEACRRACFSHFRAGVQIWLSCPGFNLSRAKFLRFFCSHRSAPQVARNFLGHAGRGDAYRSGACRDPKKRVLSPDGPNSPLFSKTI